jgi:hypothetical protein
VDFLYTCWGVPGDVPVAGDFDGDGKNDFLVRRNESGAGVFYLLTSQATSGVIPWGLATDTIIPGDFDGDGRTDICVRRTDSNNNYQHYITSAVGASTTATPIVWGATGDISVPADYDGDGATDIAVWRPNSDPTQNFFYVRRSSNSTLLAFEWGQQGDLPPASFQVK